jgi:hypothetical protein
MHTHCLVILALLFGLATPPALWPQSQPSGQDEDVEFSRTFGMPSFLSDIYSFKSEYPERSELRLYVAFINDILQFARGADEIFRARYEIAVEVLDLDGVRQDGEIVTHAVTAQRYEETNSRTIANQHSFEFDLRPGAYDVILEITDQATKRRLKRKKKFELRAFREHALGVSDVLFVNNKGVDGGWFPILHKTFEDPGASFDALFEIYPAGAKPVRLQATLVNTNNDIVYQHKTVARADEGHVLQRIPLNEGLQEAGLYRLTVELAAHEDSLSVEEVFLSQYSKVQNLRGDVASSNKLLHALKYVA